LWPSCDRIAGFGAEQDEKGFDEGRPLVTVRAYEAHDQDSVVTLWWNSWHSIQPGRRHPHSVVAWRTRWAGEIAPTQEVVVAVENGAVVGFAAADVSARVLTQIFVDPRRKRQGIGGQLLAWAKRLMPDGFRLYTLADNAVSRAFYERHDLVAGGTSTNSVNGMSTVEYRWVAVAR